MPKNLFIDPDTILKSGKITFDDIAVNAYSVPFSVEASRYQKKELLGLYRALKTVREFETALGKIKKGLDYGGIRHSFQGPLHLSIGQEAASVGQAYVLDRNDLTYGSHRGHGELIARGLRAIEQFSEEELLSLMKAEQNGGILKTIETYNNSGNIRDLALDFFLYGAMCEVFSKSTGFQQGMAGSMHAFYLPFGIYPNNAIVGASAPIAAGSALYKKLQGEKGIVVSNTGDGAAGCGVFYEAMNFSAMDQYRCLWEKKGNLPVIFAVSDNGYGMGGQTRGETMAYDLLARIGAGIAPNQLHAERINGNDVFAVIDAYKMKKRIAESGEGPVLLDVVTYRIEGHSQSDTSAYRQEEEIEKWRAHDPITAFSKGLTECGSANGEEIAHIDGEVTDRIRKICALAADDKVSPYFQMGEAVKYLSGVMFSGEKVLLPNEKPKTLIPYQENSRVKAIEKLKRDRQDNADEACALTVKDALFEALAERFYQDPLLISYGEEVREWGGACGVYTGLTESLPYERLFNSPISEAAIVSTAIGYAFCGGRAVIEIMFADFMARAADEIINQLAKWRSLSAGKLNLPIVLRAAVGEKYGAQHSQDLTALFAHIPGLKVVYPATPYDCKGLMNAALSCNDPVLFFESRRLYNKVEIFHQGGVPKEYYEVPLGEPDIKKEGRDMTVITVGPALYRAFEAVTTLEKEGISAELIDARSLVPFCYEKAAASVKKTGRLLLVGDGCAQGSFMNEFAVRLSNLCFKELKKAPVVLGASDTVTPPYEYDKEYFPYPEAIEEAMRELMQ